MEQDVAKTEQEKSLMIFFLVLLRSFSIISAINSTLWMYTMAQYFIMYANKRVKNDENGIAMTLSYHFSFHSSSFSCHRCGLNKIESQSRKECATQYDEKKVRNGSKLIN